LRASDEVNVSRFEMLTQHTGDDVLDSARTVTRGKSLHLPVPERRQSSLP
jgi:hypothetical protein